jgi:hypothetical protein
MSLLRPGAKRALVERVGPKWIAASYLRWQIRLRAGEHVPDGALESDPDWWAVDLWFFPDDWRRDDLVRQTLLLLIEQADDDLLGNIAAGPLESYISDDPGRIVWIEEQARRSPRFRQALGGVSVSGAVTAETFARLERAANRPLG